MADLSEYFFTEMKTSSFNSKEMKHMLEKEYLSIKDGE